MIKINEEWEIFLKDELKIARKICEILDEKRKNGEIIYPKQNLIFNAFNLCPLNSLKIVILGQDPYHGENEAMGLSFSVLESVKTPPSLKNIFKEIKNDLNLDRKSSNLSDLAAQGVLLLNSVLSVKKDAPASHAKLGWQEFSDKVILKISKEKSGIIFMLWGKFAQKKANLIDKNKHFILSAPHPSPLARGGFFGCKHFSKANEILTNLNKKPIIWA